MRVDNKKLLASTALAFAISANASVVANFPMDAVSQSIVETVTGGSYAISSKIMPENIPGAKGNALRFDGYSTYVPTKINVSGIKDEMTVSVWCAVETYPMMNTAEAENAYSSIIGNLDDNAKSGFAFRLSSQGDLQFECYTGGWKVACASPVKLPKYEWNHLVAVVNGTSKTVSLYNNGTLLASGKCLQGINAGSEDFYIGKPKDDLYSGPFLINTFNGLIDDITIYDNALSESEITAEKPENEADLSIPASRFAGSLLRPVFHGMPAAAWTNEPHGLVKHGGKYHLFFQKNANGAYMARLHWGHISSDNLYKWEEERIAIAPDMSYDIKGCWSGCVFTDDYLTAGKPEIFYTAVDNARATISHATPVGNDLVEWVKDGSNPVVDGRPSGLSDDFRDPYVFKSGENYYMIVGTSKDGVGATTLHRYDLASKKWSNDGSIFFKAASKSISGRFWEMPNVTNMGNGKWLFTATPLETSVGVETQYWVGTIGEDGTFIPDNAYASMPGKIELDGFGKDGFGLLSPSVMQADGKTIAIGIVPDKLPSSDNFNLGWAHNYSLPREWSLDSNGELVQKPYEGLQAMRSGKSFSKSGFELDGELQLAPVSGRKAEFVGEFEVGTSSEFGFRFFKDGDGKSASLYYTPATNMLTLDLTELPRLTNDSGVFNGLYETSLPATMAKGSIVKIHAFIDHSIIDIFINDRWAASVRLFPTATDANGIEAFSNGSTVVKSLNAWELDESQAGVGTIKNDSKGGAEISISGGILYYCNVAENSVLSLWNMSGMKILSRTLDSTSGSFDIEAGKGIYVAAVESCRGVDTAKVIVR